MVFGIFNKIFGNPDKDFAKIMRKDKNGRLTLGRVTENGDRNSQEQPEQGKVSRALEKAEGKIKPRRKSVKEIKEEREEQSQVETIYKRAIILGTTAVGLTAAMTTFFVGRGYNDLKEQLKLANQQTIQTPIYLEQKQRADLLEEENRTLKLNQPEQRQQTTLITLHPQYKQHFSQLNAELDKSAKELSARQERIGRLEQELNKIGTQLSNDQQAKSQLMATLEETREELREANETKTKLIRYEFARLEGHLNEYKKVDLNGNGTIDEGEETVFTYKGFMYPSIGSFMNGKYGYSWSQMPEIDELEEGVPTIDIINRHLELYKMKGKSPTSFSSAIQMLVDNSTPEELEQFKKHKKVIITWGLDTFGD